MKRYRLLSPYLLSLALALASAPSALADSISANPTRPGGGVPFDLVFAGDWSFTELDRGIEPTVEVQGMTIRVTVGVGPVPPIGVPVPVAYGFTAPVPGLFAGTFGTTYDVELWVDEGDMGQPFVWSIGTVRIVQGVGIQTSPKVPSDTSPAFVTVSGNAGCYEFFEPSIDDGVVTIPASFGCPILPPPPESFLVVFDLGTLPAGDYRVVVGEPGVTEHGVRQLKVLPTTVPVLDDRFEISVTRFAGDAASLAEPARPASEDSALFWFFEPENWEVMVKVLDGCAINGHYWVFGAASTDVHYLVSVTDTVGVAEWTFDNPAGQRSPAFSDTEAFPCS